MTMTCQECRNLLLDYTHGELDAAQDALVFEHLSSCEQCRAAQQAELDLTESIRYQYADELELPMSVVAGVRQAMRGRPAPTLLDTVRAALRPAIVAPAAAVLLIVAGVIGYNQLHQVPPALSSSYFVRQHVAQTLGSPSSDRSWSAYLLTSENAKTAEASAP
jgi:predicted anti-sigma-YlaC factor YlaD